MASAALNAAANPDGSGAATVGLTHSPDCDMASGTVVAALGLTRVLSPLSCQLIDLILLDHNRLRALYDAYLTTSPAMTLEMRQLLCWELIMCMSEHAAKEELVLYPAMRAVFGDAAADRCLAEHAQVKLLTAQLDAMDASDPAFDAAVRGAVESMLAHIAEEEAGMLPQLANALEPVSLLQLGIQFEAAKVRAPTRPHPESANRPPFNEAALAAAKQVDTALDQARMPSVVPALVALRPGMQGASLFAGVAAAGGAPPGAAGVGQESPVPPLPATGQPTVGGTEAAKAPPPPAAAGAPEGMEVGGPTAGV